MEEERLYDLYAIEEDIKILEEFMDRDYEMCIKRGYGVIMRNNEAHALQYLVGRIKKLRKELIEAYRKVKEEKKNNSEWITNLSKENDKLHKLVTINQEDYIPKSKIKEKIEELYEREWVFNEIRDEIIDVLQELLEEE